MRWLGVSTLLFLACNSVKKSSHLEDGFVTVDFAGSDSGRFAARGTATWCPGDSLLEITAIRQDTGLALSVLPPAEIRPESHPIIAPENVSDERPHGLAAIRWLAGDSAIRAFRGFGGKITISAVRGGTISGTLDGQFVSMDESDTLRVSGAFAKLSVGTAEGPCGRLVKGKAGR